MGKQSKNPFHAALKKKTPKPKQTNKKNQINTREELKRECATQLFIPCVKKSSRGRNSKNRIAHLTQSSMKLVRQI
jgi:hypothetical protein